MATLACDNVLDDREAQEQEHLVGGEFVSEGGNKMKRFVAVAVLGAVALGTYTHQSAHAITQSSSDASGLGSAVMLSDEAPCQRLFVGNLAWSVHSDDLNEKFSQACSVTRAYVIPQKNFGHSRGHGFVWCDSADGGMQAVSTMNGADLQGRDMRVNCYRQGGKGGGSAVMLSSCQRLLVGNLAWSVHSDDLNEKFSQACSVTSAYVIPQKNFGHSRGHGVVECDSADGGMQAVSTMNGADLQGRDMHVTCDGQGGKGEGKGGGKGTGKGTGNGAAPNTLRVVSLRADVRDEDLQAFFDGCGARTAHVQRTADGRSKGYGFVQCASEEAASDAIDKLDGANLMGRTIRVSKARA